MHPKTSIIWLNYNSMKNIEVVKSSIEGVCELDYPNFEFIVVDNGSSDGSFEAIKEFLDKKSVNQKIIRLEKNLGFCGGNNVGFRAIDSDSKYLVLLNNDCIPEKDSLNNLIEFMEQYPIVAACQGIILRLQDNNIIDSAGFYVSELLASHGFLSGKEKSMIPPKAYIISYSSGAFSLYRLDVLKRIIGGNKLFYDEAFAYFDDNFLGFKIWNSGFKVVAIPKIVGEHWGSMSFKIYSSFQDYLVTRGHVAALLISNSPYRNFLFRYLWYSSFLFGNGFGLNYGRLMNIQKAIRDGIKLGRFLNEKGEFIDINKIPTIKIKPKTMLRLILKSIISMRSIVEESRIYGQNYLSRAIKSFYFE